MQIALDGGNTGCPGSVAEPRYKEKRGCSNTYSFWGSGWVNHGDEYNKKGVQLSLNTF